MVDDIPIWLMHSGHVRAFVIEHKSLKRDVGTGRRLNRLFGGGFKVVIATSTR